MLVKFYIEQPCFQDMTLKHQNEEALGLIKFGAKHHNWHHLYMYEEELLVSVDTQLNIQQIRKLVDYFLWYTEEYGNDLEEMEL